MNIPTWLILTGIALTITAPVAAEPIEVRFGDRTLVLDDATVRQEGGRFIIETAKPMPRSSANTARVDISGSDRACIDAIAANHITISMDGSSRLQIGELTSQSIEARLDGASRLTTQSGNE